MNHQLNKQHANDKIIFTYLGKTQVFNSWHPMDDSKNKTVRAVIVRRIWKSAFFFFLELTLSFKYSLICRYPTERD